MTIHKGEGQNMWMHEGDTGSFTVSGIPDGYSLVYFSIFNEDTNKIVAELICDSVSNNVATFSFTREFSDTLKVGEFKYALKGCTENTEDTWIPQVIPSGDGYAEDSAPSFEVKPKLVEGN